MFERVGEELGYFLARLVCKEGGLRELEEGLKKFFKEIENSAKISFEFSSELNDKLVTRSKCPIYRVFQKWCEDGCLKFVEGFARAVNKDIKVKRVAKQPESDYCTFEFSL